MQKQCTTLTAKERTLSLFTAELIHEPGRHQPEAGYTAGSPPAPRFELVLCSPRLPQSDRLVTRLPMLTKRDPQAITDMQH